jgi:hypothetical protein
MEVTAWNDGKHSKTGAGYGVKLSVEDRDREFDRNWKSVTIELKGGDAVSVNVAKKSFWSGTCRELIHAEIGRWLFAKGLAPWPTGNPPKLQLVPTGKARFKLGCRS